MTKFLNISTDNTLGGSSASDEAVSSQKAIKEYVDTKDGNFVTLNTLQTLTSGKKIFANDAVMAGNQTALLATISNSNTYSTDNAWVGRYICGAKNLTFLMGTYRTMAGIGAHSWTNAQTGAGASWADFYLNPDGSNAVYIGGNLWTKNSGWMKIKNSGNTNGTVQVNRGSITSPSWKGVACWGDNISNFTNNAGYLTSTALSDYVTLNTSQTMTAAKAIFGDDVAFGDDTSQKNLLAVISNDETTTESDPTQAKWVGRLTVGAKNKTFIMGAYNGVVALGAHSWYNAQAGTGASWEDMYINPDGNKAVYIGGSPLQGKQALVKIQNVNNTTTGTVKINRSTNLSNNFKDVACWDDNVSKFTNDAGYITKDVSNLTNYTLTTSLGSAAFTSSTDYATAAQGSLADTALQATDIINNTSSTSTDAPLSANMGKSLQDQIDNLNGRGRFLALWNCSTGLAQSNPPQSPYTYKAGDYFIIGTVATGSGTNYRPTGSSYTTGVASTVVETEDVAVNDVYYYDGTSWSLQINTQKEVSFVNIGGDPYDNTNLASALNSKVTGNSSITGATKCKITYDSKGLVTAGADLASTDITTALGYTPYNSTNPSGYQANVIEEISVNGTAQTITNKAVDITVPTTIGSLSDVTINSATNGQALIYDATNQTWKNGTVSGGGGSVDIDDLSITKNGDDEIQTVGVIDQASSSRAIKTWTGLTANVPASPDANTIYNITDDDTNYLQNLLETLYPVGCLYFGTTPICPMSSLLGTWTLVGTKILTDISATLEAKGNGMALGFTDGTNNYGLATDTSNPLPFIPKSGSYGTNVGTSPSGSGISGKVMGITTDSTKSGIVADTNATSLTVNIWQRSA